MAKSKGITKHQLEIIAAASAQEAIAAYEKKATKQKKEIKKRNLRNTELLLKNYIKLKELCEDTVHQEVPEDYPEFSLESLTLESLSTYRAKTLKMMNHVDKMLVSYEWHCKKGSEEERRRFKVLKLRYLIDDRMTVKEIVELHSIDQTTVYRDSKRAIKDMSVLLFGIDAIDFC